jgi:hypothetical protein
MLKRIAMLFTAALFAAALLAPAVFAAPLPDNCTRDHGTVTCTTFDGPGNNQGGVGSTSTTQGKGNADNTSPEPQDLQSGCTYSPPKSQGAPNSC